jgi:cytochrome c oxidase subunit 2
LGRPASRAPVLSGRARGARCARIALVAACAAGALLALAPELALGNVIAPKDGVSPNAHEIDTLYKVALYIALVVFVGVEGALLYSLIRFRARRGAVAAQIRGNTRLEVGWTLGAALILVVLSVLTFAKLSDIRDPENSGPNGATLAKGSVLVASIDRRLPPNGKSLNIVVNGQQYIWRFTYPDHDDNQLNNVYAYEEMVVPTDTTVTLDIVSQDVAHSWWIPALGGKQDALPGYTNHTWFKVTEPGVYHGQCAELCGRNHADMVATVRAVPPAAFDAWLARQKRDIEAARVEQAKAVAAQNATSDSGASSDESGDTKPNGGTQGHGA